MFKIGDKVRVIESRNPFGQFKGLSKGCITKIIGGTSNMWGLDKADDKWFWRNDQIEIVYDEDSPIREVTRREIVPGQYGRVHISEKLMVRVDAIRTVEELDEAVHILNQVREVMVE